MSTAEFSLGMRRVEVMMNRVAAFNVARDSHKPLNDAICPPQLARPAGDDTSDDSDSEGEDEKKDDEKKDDEKKDGENQSTE